MAYEVRTFDDIVTAVMEELKIQSADTTTENRVKRAVNLMYMDEVVPFKRWVWLSGTTNVEHESYYTGGTCSVTPTSTTVTLSTAPSSTIGSLAGYKFAVDGYSEIYEISTHTSESTTVVLTSAYTGTINATASFKIWTDTIVLPVSCREVTEVWHDHQTAPLIGLGAQDFRRKVAEGPKTENRPGYFNQYDYVDPTPLTDETESDRYRVLRIFPSIYDSSTTLHIDYVKEVSPMSDDDDEPLMPLEDRIVLVYGALSIVWRSIGRNSEEASTNRTLFDNKLARMAGKIEAGFDKPQLVPSAYLSRKRARTTRMFSRYGSNADSTGSGSSTNPTYAEDITINGATITGNVTVSSGITIDGRDLSVDGAALDALGTLADGKIYVGNGSNVATEVTPSGDVTMSNTGVTAIEAGVIVNADINASAAIAQSKMAAHTASRALVSDGSGFAAPATTTATEIGYVNGVTSAIQTQINTKAPSASPTFTGTVTTPVTASRALVTGASSELAASATTATELGYVNGVTSAIQTQINTKAPSASPTFTGTVTTPVTASRAVVTGASNELAASATTATEIGYVNGVTSAIQTQINTKAPSASPTFTGTVTTPVTASRALVTGASSELAVSATTATELGYVNGVTSAIQTQINTKAPSASPTFTGTVTTPVTASRALVTGASSELAVSATTATELGYVNGATSNIQAQIDVLSGGASLGYFLEASNLSIACSVAGNALTIALKNGAGSDCSAGSAARIAYRSTTNATGTYTLVSTTGALSTVISSGSTAGHTNADEGLIYVGVINNAGANELCWSSTLWNEGVVITTTAEGGAGAADSKTTIYSTTARTGVASRIIAVLRSTQTTAGTWAAAPTVIAMGNPRRPLPLVAASLSANAALASGATDTIIFDTESSDPSGSYDNTTGIFTCPEEGTYLVSAIINLVISTAFNGTGEAVAIFFVVNSTSNCVAQIIPPSVAYGHRFSCTELYYLSAGDTVKVTITQDSGSSHNIAGPSSTRLSIKKLPDYQ